MLKSDGNGGYNIPKGTLALIMVIIALISCITTVVAYGVTIKNDVNHLKYEYKQSEIENVETIKDIREILNQNQNTIISHQVKIIAIHEDITEIKLNVKELILR